MLKKTLLISACLFLVLSAFSQTKNRVSILYSSANNSVGITPGWFGDVGYTGKGADQFELRYSRNIISFFSIETGLQFAHNQIEINSFGGGVSIYRNSEINLMSIPIYGNLTFLKYFFVEAGPKLDFELYQTSSTSIDDQSGIGFAVGLGGKYTFKNLTLIVNPFSEYHLMFSLQSEKYKERLYGSGIKFGLGYNF